MKRKIAISLAEGRVVRDLFENGFLELAQEQDIDLICLTPSARVPEFIKKWTRPHVQYHLLKPYILHGRSYRGARIFDLLIKRGRIGLLLWKQFQSYFFPPDPDYKTVIQDANLTVLTNPLFYTEMGVFATACALRIPTLGIVRSWDNLYKGFRMRPEKIAVWNPVNRQEAIELLRYDAEDVVITGAPQFDPYFDTNSNWSRERFARSIELDPDKPILTLATLGAFLPQFDETYLADILLGAIQSGAIDSETQLIIRLHPASRMEQFSKYNNLRNVRLSVITGYIPALGWTMSREEVLFVANLLRHSDAIVSPGSTITIEGAIFDTPTIVPLFHTYQPDLGKQQYDFHLRNHFKRLSELDLVPFVHTPEELLNAINRSLKERIWYREQRIQLARDYIYFTDGHSIQRLLNLIVSLIDKGT